MEYSIEDYVDWNTGTADFCNEEFYRVLEFGKEANNGEFIRPTRESVASGIHLASCETLAQAGDIQRLNWLFGENMVVKGYPCDHGTGVAVKMVDGSLGISAYCKYSEGAWDFFNFYIGTTWTEREFYVEDILIKERFSDVFPGFPLNRDLFETELEYSMVQQYTDAGEPLPLIYGEGGIPNFYANTAENVEKLHGLITLADRRSFSS